MSKTKCGLSINVETIIDTIEKTFDNLHELRVTGHYQAFIEFNGDIIVSFNSLGKLYRWVLASREELGEQEAAQLKENVRINAESAGDIMNKLW